MTSLIFKRICLVQLSVWSASVSNRPSFQRVPGLLSSCCISTKIRFISTVVVRIWVAVLNAARSQIGKIWCHIPKGGWFAILSFRSQKIWWNSRKFNNNQINYVVHAFMDSISSLVRYFGISARWSLVRWFRLDFDDDIHNLIIVIILWLIISASQTYALLIQSITVSFLEYALFRYQKHEITFCSPVTNNLF